ncbi:MAG: transposase [Terriglobales bacterium]
MQGKECPGEPCRGALASRRSSRKQNCRGALPGIAVRVLPIRLPNSRRTRWSYSFNRSIRIDFRGSRVTSDGGLVLVRELDERLGLGELAADCLTDTRAKNTQLPIIDLLRQSVYTRLLHRPIHLLINAAKSHATDTRQELC